MMLDSYCENHINEKEMDNGMNIVNVRRKDYLNKKQVYEGCYSSLSDNELVKCYSTNNDVVAFEEIYKRYSDLVSGLAMKHTKNKFDAEEIVQKVFLILVEKISTYREESKFSTWLYKVALNSTYLHIYNLKKTEKDISIDSIKTDNQDYDVMFELKDKRKKPDDEVMTSQMINIMKDSMKRIPKSYRTVFYLKDIQGLTNKEVCTQLGISLSAVKSRALRSRLYIRDLMTNFIATVRYKNHIKFNNFCD